MAKSVGNRPAEIFGYPAENRLAETQSLRARHWCRFTDSRCGKTSRLLDYPQFVRQDDCLVLTPSRFVSTTVDEVYQAMRRNPGLPSKDEFVPGLSAKLRARLSVRFG